jgi:hypothetical protein
MNKSAVAVLMITPTPATQLTTLPDVGCGSMNLVYASYPIELIAMNNNTQLAKEAKMVALENP